MAKGNWWVGRYGRSSGWRLFAIEPSRSPAGAWRDDDGGYGLNVPEIMVPDGIEPGAGIDEPIPVELPARLVLARGRKEI